MNQMMKKISTSQVTITISTALIADGFIVSSRSIAQHMQTPDVWISFFLGGLVSLVCGYCCAKLTQYYPGQTIFQYVQYLLGKPIGTCIGLLYVIWYIMVAAYQIRILGEFAQQFLLNRTPPIHCHVPPCSGWFVFTSKWYTTYGKVFSIIFPAHTSRNSCYFN
ncbi:GerAB/ArcD/ProY family transporter [Bacillus cereus]